MVGWHPAGPPAHGHAVSRPGAPPRRRPGPPRPGPLAAAHPARAGPPRPHHALRPRARLRPHPQRRRLPPPGAAADAGRLLARLLAADLPRPRRRHLARPHFLADRHPRLADPVCPRAAGPMGRPPSRRADRAVVRGGDAAGGAPVLRADAAGRRRPAGRPAQRRSPRRQLRVARPARLAVAPEAVRPRPRPLRRPGLSAGFAAAPPRRAVLAAARHLHRRPGGGAGPLPGAVPARERLVARGRRVAGADGRDLRQRPGGRAAPRPGRAARRSGAPAAAAAAGGVRPRRGGRGHRGPAPRLPAPAGRSRRLLRVRAGGGDRSCLPESPRARRDRARRPLRRGADVGRGGVGLPGGGARLLRAPRPAAAARAGGESPAPPPPRPPGGGGGGGGGPAPHPQPLSHEGRGEQSVTAPPLHQRNGGSPAGRRETTFRSPSSAPADRE